MALIRSNKQGAALPETVDVVVTHSTSDNINVMTGFSHDIASHYSKIKYTVLSGSNVSSIKFANGSFANATYASLESAITASGQDITTTGVSFNATGDIVVRVGLTVGTVIKVTLYN